MSENASPKATAKLIFLRAREERAEDRDRFLDEACGPDTALRTRVRALLDADASAGEFLEGDAHRVHEEYASHGARAISPRQIGPYQLLDVIGEGGFGTVYLAEQEKPVHRRVALKLIKHGMDTKQVIARFEAERQALAMMDHPNIARVLDAGATETGRPYFVMELVHGVPITVFSDDAKLTARQRLELFIPICQAVQHAHQKGVIHRDIKPSNVLVTLHDLRPVPKVIDFGIAKATETPLTEKTLLTEARTMIGTPEYMSPEQAGISGLDVDTRSDVYSLGVLLYELLTGSTPFDSVKLRSKAYGEMQRVIREQDPPSPSARLSTSEKLRAVAAQRSTEPGKLRATVRGELDWIVMRCIEKDRARRYESAAALAADVGRYLADEPVQAVAPSRTYRLRKTIRRHKIGVAATLAVAVTLVAGIVGTTIGLIHASRAGQIAVAREREAMEQAGIADAVSRFQRDMLASANPGNMLGDKVTVVEVMRSAVKELDGGKLKDQPAVEAAVRDTIAGTLHGLGQFDAAEANYSRALELRRAHSTDPVAIADTLNNLGGVYYSQGRIADAERTLRQSLEMARHAPSASPSLLAPTEVNLALALQAEGKFAPAEVLLREANDAYLHSNADELTRATGLSHLGQLFLDQGKFQESEPLLRQTLALRRSALPPAHPDTISALSNLALTLMQEEKYDEATTLAREAVEDARKTFPPNHPDIASTLATLGTILILNNQYTEAEPPLRECLAIQRIALPPKHPDLAPTLNNLARVLRELHKPAEAEANYREALEIARIVLPADDPNIADCVHSIALSLIDQSKFVEAEPLIREAIGDRTKRLGNEHWRVAAAKMELSDVLVGQNRYADAEPVLLEAHNIFSSNPKTARLAADSAEKLAQLYEAWNRVDPQADKSVQAERWRKRKLDESEFPSQ